MGRPGWWGGRYARVGTKIARAHLNEFPDYTRLAKMEAEAEANGTAPGE